MRWLWLLYIRNPNANHGSTILIHRCSMMFIYFPYVNHGFAYLEPMYIYIYVYIYVYNYIYRLFQAAWTFPLDHPLPKRVKTQLPRGFSHVHTYLTNLKSIQRNWAQNQRTALILNEAALSPLQRVAEKSLGKRGAAKIPWTNGYWTSTGMLDIRVSNISNI